MFIPCAPLTRAPRGAQGCTLVSFGAARRAGLVDADGTPVGTFGRVNYIQVRGIVAGASDNVPTMTITCACLRCRPACAGCGVHSCCCVRVLSLHAADEVAGSPLRVTAGVTRATLGCDLLVSRHDILRLQADGFTLSAKA